MRKKWDNGHERKLLSRAAVWREITGHTLYQAYAYLHKPKSILSFIRNWRATFEALGCLSTLDNPPSEKKIIIAFCAVERRGLEAFEIMAFIFR